ncbi:7-alpha-hydroxycholest-4-en-3-one 12-alpha-hydroxylase [Perognathus longimembris pacificus]|uniref:7-alpha-hydroxycholest-4-en-3-one 12-alpha-hydroxylase n=1 Tax=Perognathus longimembris pacificus TaxID=214514 RepID=UPI002018E014|nr:7-alpha-hydroxycholest-4-en-3-one 12-alpha-hydroxylase [Perognathus longimembris pacificus]
MFFWGLVFGALLALVAVYLFFPGLFRQRGPQEPPLDKGFVPWLGHALAFRRNMFEFLKRMQAKHGDVFTLQLGGQYFTYIMDPLSFGQIIKESRKKLDFVEYAQELVLQVFGYQSTKEDHRMIHSASVKYLMGDGLEELNTALLESLSLVMLGPKGRSPQDGGWHEDGLFHFCYNIIFKAGYLSLFGSTKDQEQDLLHAEELFVQFRRFDVLFPRFVYSLLSPREWLEVNRLQQHFHHNLSVAENRGKEGVSAWLSHMLQHLGEQGRASEMQDRFNFMMLWASQGNTGPTSFWALLFLLKNPTALRAVRKEALEVLGERRLEEHQFFPFEISALKHTPVLDSVVEETLRLGATPTLLRVVQEDYVLHLASGHQYVIRQGDKLALFPYLSVHMDSDIHPEPTCFKYDRFLNPDGSRKVDFYKKGKKIHHYSMPWGSGTSICPGRFFALSEVKLFILIMVIYFDLELVDPDIAIPPLDPGRWGFGTSQPTHDVSFRYRLKPLQ